MATLADLAKTERSDGTFNPDPLVTLKVEGGGLRILTDPEAAVYNKVQGEAAVRKLRHANRRTFSSMNRNCRTASGRATIAPWKSRADTFRRSEKSTGT